MPASLSRTCRAGHTLIELVAASTCSVILLAGLGSVMFVARQVAHIPTASTARIEAATTGNQLADELRFATMIFERSDHAIEFAVADRSGPADGRAERIRYEWSGTPGDPLLRTANGAAVAVVDAVHNFQITATIVPEIEPLATTVESSEAQLVGTSMATSSNVGITADYWLARRIDPNQFPSSIGGISKNNAVYWNATRARFQARSVINPNAGSVSVQLRTTGDTTASPTSHVLGEVLIQEVNLTSNFGWNNAQFAVPVQRLSLDRKYSLVWEGDVDTPNNHAQLIATGSAAGNVTKSVNRGTSWESEPLDVYFQLYGTYSTPGPNYQVTRNRITYINLILQTDDAANSRIETAIPLLNRPETFSAYWRADLGSGGAPTGVDLDGNGDLDWTLVGGELQTNPSNNFAGVTYIDARCRAGAVLRINADRQGNTHGPLIVRVVSASGAHSLSLSGETAVNTEKALTTVERLPSDWVRFQLLIAPQQNVVRLQVQDQVVGAYVYPTYTTSTTNRCISLAGGGANFDYVEAGILSDAVVQ